MLYYKYKESHQRVASVRPIYKIANLECA